MTNKLISEFIKNKDPRIIENDVGDPLWKGYDWPITPVDLSNYYTKLETNNSLNLKANLISPTFTGTPTVPNLPSTTSNTQIANTSFVVSAINAITYPVTSINGKTGTVVLTKNDLGLSNVDNTSDVNKPTSLLQMTSIDTAVATGVEQHDLRESSHNILFGTKIRNRLTANTTLYVRTDGNDSNNGSANTSGTAFKTLAGAMNYVAGIDQRGFRVTISLASGTYSGSTIYGYQFNGVLSITSTDTSDPATIAGLVITNSTNLVQIGNLIFTGGYYMLSIYSALCGIIGPITFTGTTTYACLAINNLSRFRFDSSGIAMHFDNVTCTVTVFITEIATAYFNNAVITGSSTGQRFNISYLSTVNTHYKGPEYFPGTTDGVADTATGGYLR